MPTCEVLDRAAKSEDGAVHGSDADDWLSFMRGGRAGMEDGFAHVAEYLGFVRICHRDRDPDEEREK